MKFVKKPTVKGCNRVGQSVRENRDSDALSWKYKIKWQQTKGGPSGTLRALEVAPSCLEKLET